MAGGSVEADSKGEFRRVIGDTVLKGQTFDFIKCDVEGSELKVLRGLTELIKSCSPELFVEVWEENAAEFKDWATSLGYSVVNEIRRYDIATNLYLKRSALRPVATLRSRFRKRAAEQVRRLSNFGQ